MNKILKNMLAIVLAFVMMFSTVSTVNAKSYNLPEKTYVVQENGVKYTISAFQDADGTRITIQTDNSNDFVVEEISNNEEILEVTEFEYEKTSFNGVEQFSEESEVYDLEEYNENACVKSESVNYNKKKRGGFGSSTYYYQYGYKGKKSYCRVGKEKKSNSVRIDNNTSKEKKCDTYADYLDSSRSCYNKACVYSAASGVGIGVVSGLVSANIVFPVSVIITIVVAAVGGGSSIIASVNSLIDSWSYSTKAKNQFTNIHSLFTFF